MSPAGEGVLTVSVGDAWDAVRPSVSVIDGKTLQLVKTSRCDEPVSLPEGTYVVRATLPSGERATDVVTVTAGDAQEVRLATSDEPRAGDEPRLETLGATPARPRRGVTRGVKRAWYVRFWESVPGEPLARAEPSVELEEGDEDALRISPTGIGLLRAQFAVPGAVPLNVALPVYGMTSVQSCRVAVTATSGDIAADVSLPDNLRADGVARYLQTGNLREAADLIGDAESLLAQKMADPFAAALGGYALVRLHRLDLLHRWPRNLSAWFAWLPDGAAIAAEEAALEGDHAWAVRELRDAARRGIPVFTDGCAILMSRLREYGAARTPPPGVTEEDLADVRAQLQRLQPLAPFMDFARISLAYRACNPADVVGSQHAFVPEAGTGWLRYDPRAPGGLAAVA